MLIRIALLFALTAFTLLVFAKLLIALGIPLLPELATKLALIALFGVSTLFSAISIWAISKWLSQSVCDFFSAPQRRIRRLRFIELRHNQIRQLFHYRTVQIKYFHELKRKKLLDTDNKRQIRALSAAIRKELATLQKNQIPKSIVKELQQNHRNCHNHQDSNGLLLLQQKIANLKQYDND